MLVPTLQLYDNLWLKRKEERRHKFSGRYFPLALTLRRYLANAFQHSFGQTSDEYLQCPNFDRGLRLYRYLKASTPQVRQGANSPS